MPNLVYEGLMRRKDALAFKRYWEQYGHSVTLDSAGHKDHYHVYRRPNERHGVNLQS